MENLVHPGADSSDLYRTGRQQGGVSSVLLQWTYEYKCTSGLREQVTDPNGLAIATTYDRYGRPTMRAEGSWRDTRVTYNDPGRWIVTQDDVAAAGDQRNVRVARFDQLGRLRLTQQLEQTTTPAAAGADESLGIKTETRYRFTPGINAVEVDIHLLRQVLAQQLGALVMEAAPARVDGLDARPAGPPDRLVIALADDEVVPDQCAKRAHRQQHRLQRPLA